MVCNDNYSLCNTVCYNIYVKSYPVSRHINRLGGFRPSPPRTKKYDKDGCLTDKSHQEWCNYEYNLKRWEKYIKPFEEVFGVKFSFPLDKDPDKEYIRKKNYGLLEPLNIKDVKHPLDDIIS